MAWVLAVLSVSERLPLLSYLLSVAVLAHAMFALIGYCFLNTRVRRNLYISLLRCVGKKVPLDSSEVTTGGTSSHSHQGVPSSQQHSVWENCLFFFPTSLPFIRFEVFMSMRIHDVAFWVLTHCSLVRWTEMFWENIQPVSLVFSDLEDGDSKFLQNGNHGPHSTVSYPRSQHETIYHFQRECFVYCQHFY
jgi:hypothetical protein